MKAHGLTQTHLGHMDYYDQDERDRATWKRERWQEWQTMPLTAQNLFVAVGRAYNLNQQTRHVGEFVGWVTRQQIAHYLKPPKSFLTPYNLKLLDHLTGVGLLRGQRPLFWINKAKRTRWRTTFERPTYAERKRPAGYEWVYQPDPDVIKALLEMSDQLKGK